MGHSLVYWAGMPAGRAVRQRRADFRHDQFGQHARHPEYGPVSAAKAIPRSPHTPTGVGTGPAGITANAILAGVTDTPALRLIPGHEKLMEIARLRNPNKRLTTPEDVGRCIAALCHPATYWMTGNTIHVDGGENIVG
jgi:NAD(P)-dependent dehydrogenase (short-subunit alcohol dehydrogenase family)